MTYIILISFLLLFTMNVGLIHDQQSNRMTQRLSKLAECLYNENYEMAVEMYEGNRDPRQSFNEPEEVQLLLAKAYFLNQKYSVAQTLAAKLKNAHSYKVLYQSYFLEYKALYLQGRNRYDILEQLKSKLTRDKVTDLPRYINEIEEVLKIAGRGDTSAGLQTERRQFEELLKSEEDSSVVMEGMPMFLVSESWFQNWMEFTSSDYKIQRERRHPGPIMQFNLIDHLYNVYFDSRAHKEYTNRFIFPTVPYKLLPKKCWQFLQKRYGGIEVKRFNISFIDKPLQIITEVNLKRILIARMDNNHPETKNFVLVQITKKENWEGLRQKLGINWGQGQICEEKSGKAVTDKNNFEEIDTVGKRYLYLPAGKNQKESMSKGERCGNPKCQKGGQLYYCQCKTIKYCSMECLKEHWRVHKAKCQLEQEHLRRKPVTFKEFRLEEKDYGGRRGVVGLKNLGNTCYMNSGLQCLSNTKELTEYFMRDEFKSHINSSNPLGTKGNLACAYAELIREMWTGSSQALAPTRLKKKLGEFATQFAGYGQQDSQELISYLIDGLQQDLNLVKKKQTFQVSDQIKPDEQMSRESEYNFSKRIQSYIRNLMVGQFKSTVVCGQCSKVSVCFDPYMLISLPIASNKEDSFYFVTSITSKGALKINYQYSSTSTLASITRLFAPKYNENYYREIREGLRERIADDGVMFLTLDPENFNIVNILAGSHKVSSLDQNLFLFIMQVSECKSSEELILCEYQYQGKRFSYPRLLKFNRSTTSKDKERVILQSLQRGLSKKQKQSFRGSYSQLVYNERSSQVKDLPFGSILIQIKKDLKLSTFVEGYNDGFGRFVNLIQENAIVLEDCFRYFTQKERLERENSWYCNKCKDFKQATKQMEIYKTNKILVLAFKRFSRHSKITVPIKYPIEGLNIGPYLLSNKTGAPVIYDLYGVVNHHGSLYGGHYTAYCQNFLSKQWYQFNDSRVSRIDRSQIITPYSYVLFYRLRDK